MTDSSPNTQQVLDALREAVRQALDRKKRLGQYAVVWRDGQLVYIGEDAPTRASPAPGSHDKIPNQSVL